jgi:SET domain-containing protein
MNYSGLFNMKLSSLPRKSGLYLKHVHPKGRGVFCSEPIAAGEIIEVSPVLIFAEDDVEAIQYTSLSDYLFGAKSSYSRSAYLRLNIIDSSKAVSLPMGITSFCNHLADANASYAAAEEENIPFFVLGAVRDIPQDTEICISYGSTWFSIRNIKATD